MAGLLVWWAFPPSATIQALLILLLFVLGVWSASVAGRYFRANDPGPVVLDEVVGMLITLWLIPVGWTGALVGFLLFRVFDIVKPYPARQLEGLHGGLGVMADDVMAAIYANLVLRVLVAVGS
jgi:phosphatidylglycerophosphatase A